MLVTECMDDIMSHLASCHLSKFSKSSKDNENELDHFSESTYSRLGAGAPNENIVQTT